ncbi:MAG: hypothetical protein Q8O92_09380 [Candidatus Latescibacter sp.]|nr:hypothetical protein [Candidatus Latescibacter sp.]
MRRSTLRARALKKPPSPYDEFLRLQEELQDYDDLRCLREAKEAERDALTLGMDELKKKIGE